MKTISTKIRTRLFILALFVSFAGPANAADKPGWSESIKSGLTNACVKTFQLSIKLRYQGVKGRPATAEEIKVIDSAKPTFRNSCTCSINRFSRQMAYAEIKNNLDEVNRFFMSTFKANGSCAINQQDLQTRMNNTIQSMTKGHRVIN